MSKNLCTFALKLGASTNRLQIATSHKLRYGKKERYVKAEAATIQSVEQIENLILTIHGKQVIRTATWRGCME